MKKIFFAACFILFLISCKDPYKGYDKSYENDDKSTIILIKKGSSGGGAASIPIEKAISMVRHNHEQSKSDILTTPIFIDLDFDDFATIVKDLNGEVGEKKVRIYFGAYNDTNTTNKILINHRAVVATGVVDSVERKAPGVDPVYYNLGSLCPPECGGGTGGAGMKPNPTKAILYAKSGI